MRWSNSPLSNAAKHYTETLQRCRLPGRSEHNPVYSAVPACLPEACSASSPLNHNGKGSENVVVVVAVESRQFAVRESKNRNCPMVQMLGSTIFALYGGRFSSHTSPTPFTIASQNSGASDGFMKECKRPVRAGSSFQFHCHLIRRVRPDVVIPRRFEMKNVCDCPRRIKHSSILTRFPRSSKGRLLWTTIQRVATAS